MNIQLFQQNKLEQILENESDFKLSDNSHGYILESENFKIEYTRNQFNLRLEIKSTPYYIFDISINPNNTNLSGLETSHIYKLTGHPDNQDTQIINNCEKLNYNLESMPQEFKNLVNQIQQYKQSQNEYVDPKDEYFETVDKLSHTILTHANFYQTFREWIKEYRFDQMSKINQIKFNNGLEYKFNTPLSRFTKKDTRPNNGRINQQKLLSKK